MDQHKQVVRRLLYVAGTTFAGEAGIRISNKPIGATIAMRAGHELFSDALKTPRVVLAADRQTMIKAFGRAHYSRYDESSATRLTEMAQRVVDEWVRRISINAPPAPLDPSACPALPKSLVRLPLGPTPAWRQHWYGHRSTMKYASR